MELLDRKIDERGAAVSSRLLVEAAVPGLEFSVETFDGAVVAVVAKHLGAEPFFVETGHDVPAPVPGPIARELGDTALRALAVLGLGWGAAHTELRLPPAGPVIIEVNPRLAGGMIPVAVRAATGIDLVDAIIARVVGRAPAPAGAGAGAAAVRFTQTTREGQVVGVRGVAEAGAAPGVVAVTSPAVGRKFQITHSFLDRVACVVASGADSEQAADRAAVALELVAVDLAAVGNLSVDPVNPAGEPPQAASVTERGVSG